MTREASAEYFPQDQATSLKRGSARCWARLPLALAAAGVVNAGCGPQVPAQAASASAPLLSEDRQPFRSHTLTLYGYNYTDSELSSFEVDGQGGGNLEVSTTTAGGGKSTCCVRIHSPLLAAQPVTIKWSRDVETWCEQTVLLQPPLPANPEYFEVHFYRDGHIEVAVTAAKSSPRLRLDRDGPGNRYATASMNINNDSSLSRCKRGYR